MPAILAQSGDTLDLELPNSVGNMECMPFVCLILS